MNDREFETQITGSLPALRAYASALTDRRCDADDAVGDTLSRANELIESGSPLTLQQVIAVAREELVSWQQADDLDETRPR